MWHYYVNCSFLKVCFLRNDKSPSFYYDIQCHKLSVMPTTQIVPAISQTPPYVVFAPLPRSTESIALHQRI